MIVRLHYLALLLLLPAVAGGGADFPAGSTRLSLTVEPQCSIAIVSRSPADLGAASQMLTFLYKVRTSKSGGQGQISLHFDPLPMEGALLNFQTEVTGVGVALAGAVALQPGVVIVRFGARASSTRAGNTGTLQYTVGPAPAPKLEPSLSISCQ